MMLVSKHAEMNKALKKKIVEYAKAISLYKRKSITHKKETVLQ